MRVDVASSSTGGSGMVEVGSEDSWNSGFFFMSTGVPSTSDGGVLRVTSSSLSFSNEGSVTIVGGESFVRYGGDASPSTS